MAVTSSAPKPPSPAKGSESLRDARNARRGANPNRALIASALVHAILVGALVYIFWQPPRPPRVEVFELVSLEPPKLRPLAPKTVEPPPPPEETPVETRAPEAPKLTSTPKKPVSPSKPEPTKPAAPTQDTAKNLPVREIVRENTNTNPVQVSNAPVNSRMNFWAGRVKAAIGGRWNPPMGIDVEGAAKTVVRFRVSMRGEISSVEISQSSGNKQLDEEGTRAVKRTENVPPPPVPSDFSEEFLQVSYEFIYQGH